MEVANFDYEHWLAVARRYSRRRDEAADVLHDSLLEAIRAGRTNFSDEPTQRWFAGVLRNRAAMTARSAVRRARRETAATKPKTPRDDAATPPPSKDFLQLLPRSARSVALLALAGLQREEIVAALGIAPTAFRQRLTTIRKAWDDYGRAHPRLNLPESSSPLFHPRPDPEFELGLIRRALLDVVRHTAVTGASIGAHDPDGHLIVIAGRSGERGSSQSARRRQQDG